MSKQIIEAVNESWENEGGSLAVLPPERPIEASLFLTEFYAVDGRAFATLSEATRRAVLAQKNEGP
jgi:hypothetical protein